MYRLQLAGVSANQDHRRADTRAGESYCTANAAARTRNGNYPSGEIVGAGAVISRLKGMAHSNSSMNLPIVAFRATRHANQASDIASNRRGRAQFGSAR